jgi:hypothetical protein
MAAGSKIAIRTKDNKDAKNLVSFVVKVVKVPFVLVLLLGSGE